MEEIKSLIRVWISAFAALIYCYVLVPKLPKGSIRFFSILPVIYLFTILPWQLSTLHLRAISAFYLTWLCTFKLLLLCFNTGPLSHPNAKQYISNFILIAAFPIKIKDLSSGNPRNSKPNLQQPALDLKTLLNLAIKGSLLVVIINLYTFKHRFHPKILLFLYCIHMFLMLEVLLVPFACLARTFLDLDLEPQFNKPYLSTSLQDFWGRRWNLVVTNTLRPTVYEPARRISGRVFGNRCSSLPAVVATFVVSGLMHEIMFYYVTVEKPSWEVTLFFVLHGFATAAEIAVKRGFPATVRLRPVSSLLTFGFLLSTGFWLFFPPITRHGSDLKVIAELYALMDYFTDKFGGWVFPAYFSERDFPATLSR